MSDFDDSETRRRVRETLNDGLVALLQFAHPEGQRVYAALLSQDPVEKARTLADVVVDAKPGEADEAMRAAVGRGAVIAGELLAAQPNPVADALA